MFEIMYESIYLLETRESIKNNENIYKIGRTCQDELKRFNTYPRGSKLHIHISCINSCEIEQLIIKLFNNQFENVDTYGKEYFKGNLLEMIKIVLHNVSHSFDCLSSSNEYCKKLSEVKYNNTKLHNEIQELKICVDHITQRSNKQKIDYESLLKTIINKQSSENLINNITSKNNDLYCEKCNKHFSNVYNFRIHTQTCKGNKLECSTCKKTFSSPQSIYNHKNNVSCKPSPQTPSLLQQGPT